MIEEITKLLKIASEKVGITDPLIKLEHPDDISHGDFSSNVAMVHAKALKVNPKALAEKIVEEFNNLVSASDSKDNILPAEVAGPGFINFKIADSFFINKIVEISKNKKTLENFGKNKSLKDKQFIIEHTQPNPFKEFHIGHLMNNTIGESIARIYKENGADVKMATYHGDVGMHVAKTIWAMLQSGEFQSDISYLGKMYAEGSTKYETDENVKKEIIEINKQVFERTDEKVNKAYDFGRKLSLEYFEEIYKRLGSQFDYHFYESESGKIGKDIVLKFLDKGVFEKGDNDAVVFKGENFVPKTHTRVFLNGQGLPTYEAKEIGLAQLKLNFLPNYDSSITVTANEQDAFFNVVEVAIQQVFPELKGKLFHLSHGMLKLPSGKMSSRTGSIISAESLIDQTKEKVFEKISDRNFDTKEKENIAETVAIAAIKYSILRQSIGGDIIFDFDKSLSFEGDSGPYLQYATVRASAVISKAQQANILETITEKPEKSDLLEKLLLRFPEVIEHARVEYAPHFIVTYLTELASTFNSYYANNQIIDEKNALSSYRVVLSKVFVQVMKNGLNLLGIKVPERM